MILSESTRKKPQFEAVMCFCFDKNGNLILLQKREDHRFYPGLWGIPAGRVEPGENINSAMRRELGEETGNKVPAKMLSLVFETNHRHTIKKTGDILYFKGYTFVCEKKLGKIILDEKEHMNYVTMKQYLVPGINKRNLIPDTLELHEMLTRINAL